MSTCSIKWPQQYLRTTHGKDETDVMVDLYLSGWQILQHFQCTTNDLSGQEARVDTSGGFTQDVADRSSNHFELTRAMQMLSIAKKMACSTLPTHVFFFMV